MVKSTYVNKNKKTADCLACYCCWVTKYTVSKDLVNQSLEAHILKNIYIVVVAYIHFCQSK